MVIRNPRPVLYINLINIHGVLGLNLEKLKLFGAELHCDAYLSTLVKLSELYLLDEPIGISPSIHYPFIFFTLKVASPPPTSVTVTISPALRRRSSALNSVELTRRARVRRGKLLAINSVAQTMYPQCCKNSE